MLNELEIREQLANLLDSKISRDEFEDWLVQNSWNIHHNNDLAAQKLSYAIELRLAENEEGNLSDEQFRNELLALLRRPFIISNLSVQLEKLVASSSSISLSSPQSWEVRSVDMQFATAASSRARH